VRAAFRLLLYLFTWYSLPLPAACGLRRTSDCYDLLAGADYLNGRASRRAWDGSANAPFCRDVSSATDLRNCRLPHYYLGLATCSSILRALLLRMDAAAFAQQRACCLRWFLWRTVFCDRQTRHYTGVAFYACCSAFCHFCFTRLFTTMLMRPWRGGILRIGRLVPLFERTV